MSPQTVIGASSSRKTGWDRKIFFDVSIRYLISDSVRSTWVEVLALEDITKFRWDFTF